MSERRRLVLDWTRKERAARKAKRAIYRTMTCKSCLRRLREYSARRVIADAAKAALPHGFTEGEPVSWVDRVFNFLQRIGLFPEKGPSE